jgi:hypothetical protein
LQQKLGVLINAVLVHAPTSVSARLVPQVEVVMVVLVGQIGNAWNQILVLLVGPALASIGFEVMDINSQWDAGAATIAIRTVSEKTAAAKPTGHQFRVNIVVDQMAGRGDL